MAVKFPLKMAGEARVKTLEELREHFDLAAVLGYYDDGRLIRWLRNGFYDKEAEQVETLDKSTGDFVSNLCEILGVAYQENLYGRVDLDDIIKRNDRIEKLRRFTADAEILSAVDRVAFSQKELDALVCKEEKEIYLCGEYFTIPGDIENVVYIGLNNPTVEFGTEIVKSGIDFQNVAFDIENYVGEGKKDAFTYVFNNNLKLGIKLLQESADQDNIDAQIMLGLFNMEGVGVDQNYEEAVKWYRKAANLGSAEAQNRLGIRYYNGEGIEQSYEEAVKWFQKAAEQGYAKAQNNLGVCYYKGEVVEQNYEEAAKWYQKAAEQGYAIAQFNLGRCYYNGEGVEQSYEEAVKWYRKAAEQGCENAKEILKQLVKKPKLRR